jgi:hypothetical protein
MELLRAFCASIMMEAGKASETFDCGSILTQLVARDGFIAFVLVAANFKSYIVMCLFINGKEIYKFLC